jgi:hypothetical protein
MHVQPTHPTGTPRQDRFGLSLWHMTWHLAMVTVIGLTLLSPSTVQARTFQCRAGDMACLIAAIQTANTQPGPQHEIRLEAGTYPLTAVDNDTDGYNCLPSITSSLTIQGAGAQATIIERQFFYPPARLIHVAATGTLTLNGLTLTGGGVAYFTIAGALFNNGGRVTIRASNVLANSGYLGVLKNVGGTMTITDSIIADNYGQIVGGAIENSGTMTISNTTLAHNGVFNDCCFSIGGAISNSGTMTITNSTLFDNVAVYVAQGGAIANSGMLTIINSTLAGNDALYDNSYGGAIDNSGILTILNSTLANNSANDAGGGLANSGTAYIQNTILALNTTSGSGPDCADPTAQGSIISGGNNLIGTVAGCPISLQSTDLTGDPGLGAFTDDGTPGNGHFPLLFTSPAIDAGNDAACPKKDQLGEKRVGICDIGAIEFQGAAVSSR